MNRQVRTRFGSRFVSVCLLLLLSCLLCMSVRVQTASSGATIKAGSSAVNGSALAETVLSSQGFKEKRGIYPQQKNVYTLTLHESGQILVFCSRDSVQTDNIRVYIQNGSGSRVSDYTKGSANQILEKGTYYLYIDSTDCTFHQEVVYDLEVQFTPVTVDGNTSPAGAVEMESGKSYTDWGNTVNAKKRYYKISLTRKSLVTITKPTYVYRAALYSDYALSDKLKDFEALKNDRRYEHFELDPGTYYLEITAGYPTSYNFTIMAVITPMPGAVKSSASVDSNGLITLTWNKTAGVDAYSVFEKKDGKWTEIGTTVKDHSDWRNSNYPKYISGFSFQPGYVFTGSRTFAVVGRNVPQGIDLSREYYVASQFAAIFGDKEAAAVTVTKPVEKPAENISGGSTKTTVKKITPAKTAFTSVTSPAKKSIKLIWKKSSKATGYQIQYGTSKTFKGAKSLTVSGKSKVSATIKKLSSKKMYYVRIRSIRKSGGVTTRSAWSAVRKIKVK